MTNNPIVEQICFYVKKQILSNAYQENEKISERLICEHFNTSRTLVREAFYELKRGAWLYSTSKSGTYVAPLDVAAIHENFHARLALEPHVLIMAYPHITEEDLLQMRENCDHMQSAKANDEYSIAENAQHVIICSRANNRFVSSFLDPMIEDMMRIASKCGTTKDRQIWCAQEWLKIIKHLEKKEIGEAVRHFTRHIQDSYDAFQASYSRFGM